MTNPSACVQCLRRSWLLGLLAPYIERETSPSPGGKLLALLSLAESSGQRRCFARRLGARQ